MKTLHRLTQALLVAALLLTAAPSASALDGRDALQPTAFIIITGEDVFDAGPLPDELLDEPQLAGYRAGYMCEVFGVLWAYINWWDCQPVIYRDDSYDNSPEAAAVVNASYNQMDMTVGWWNANGRWVFLGFFGLLILINLVGKLLRESLRRS